MRPGSALGAFALAPRGSAGPAGAGAGAGGSVLLSRARCARCEPIDGRDAASLSQPCNSVGSQRRALVLWCTQYTVGAKHCDVCNRCFHVSSHTIDQKFLYVHEWERL